MIMSMLVKERRLVLGLDFRPVWIELLLKYRAWSYWNGKTSYMVNTCSCFIRSFSRRGATKKLLANFRVQIHSIESKNLATTHQAGSDAKSATKVGEPRGTATEKKGRGTEKERMVFQTLLFKGLC